jgi:hypothetical protein
LFFFQGPYGGKRKDLYLWEKAKKSFSHGKGLANNEIVANKAGDNPVMTTLL